jgi:hypothetical protein
VNGGRRSDPHANFLWVMALLALVAYTLPWLTSSTASLSFGGYDLAEWASLHPDVRAAPLLVTSLLLRLQPTLLAFIIAVNSPRPTSSLRWRISAAFVSVIVIGLLPPLEFFVETSSDGNHQQQLGIALLTLLGGVVGLSGLLSRWKRPITIAVALTGAASSVAAFFQAIALMARFNLHVQVGWGALLLSALCILLALTHVRWNKRKRGGPAVGLPVGYSGNTWIHHRLQVAHVSLLQVLDCLPHRSGLLGVLSSVISPQTPPRTP